MDMRACQRLAPQQHVLVLAARRDNVERSRQTRLPRATVRIVSGLVGRGRHSGACSAFVERPTVERPLPLKLVTVGKDRGTAMESVALEYVQKIQRYCAFEEVQLRPNPKHSRYNLHPVVCLHVLVNVYLLRGEDDHVADGEEGWHDSDVSTQVASEGERVMRSISTKDWVVLLDERGKEMTSEKFADLIADAGDTGASAVVFCIGGPFGHGPQVRERANVSVKLSTMVLNHQVAFLVLLEQIYRAWTILRGEKYHH